MSSSITTVNSLKDLVKNQVSLAFETMMNEAINEIEDEMIKRVYAKTNEMRNEAKKTAANMTFDLVQEMNIDGLRLEIKI